MSALSKTAVFGLVSALALGSLAMGTDAHAGKKKNKRTTTQTSVSTGASINQMQIYTGNPNANKGPGGPRTGSDRIDLSVCDLETFDHKKCLGD